MKSPLGVWKNLVGKISTINNRILKKGLTKLKLFFSLKIVLVMFKLQLKFNCCFLKSLRDCLVGWGCRIPWLHLCSGVRPPSTRNDCLGFDTKQSDGEIPVILELWEMQSTPSLPSLPGPPQPVLVEPDRDLTMGSNRTKQCTYAKLNSLRWDCYDI